MHTSTNFKEQFLAEREQLFSNRELYNDSFKFCIKHSLLVEEFIIKIIHSYYNLIIK